MLSFQAWNNNFKLKPDVVISYLGNMCTQCFPQVEDCIYNNKSILYEAEQQREHQAWGLDSASVSD